MCTHAEGEEEGCLCNQKASLENGVTACEKFIYHNNKYLEFINTLFDICMSKREKREGSLGTRARKVKRHSLGIIVENYYGFLGRGAIKENHVGGR